MKREDAVRRFAADRVSDGTATSYVTYLWRVKRMIGTDGDTMLLTEAEVTKIAATLCARGVPRKSAANCGSALNMYAAYTAKR